MSLTRPGTGDPASAAPQPAGWDEPDARRGPRRGFAGLRAQYRLSRLGERAELVLADPRPASLARPALPEVALAGKPVGQARFVLAPAGARCGARLVPQAAVRVDAPGGR
jgi:hypothetical protein